MRTTLKGKFIGVSQGATKHDGADCYYPFLLAVDGQNKTVLLASRDRVAFTQATQDMPKNKRLQCAGHAISVYSNARLTGESRHMFLVTNWKIS